MCLLPLLLLLCRLARIMRLHTTPTNALCGNVLSSYARGGMATQAQGREGGMYDSVSGTEANLSFTNNPQLMARGEDYGRQVRYMHVPVASSL